MSSDQVQFNVVCRVKRTGRATVMNVEPLTIKEAETWAAKLTVYPWRENLVQKIGE